MQFSKKLKSEILEKLTSRGVNAVCPRCGNNSFTLVDGMFVQVVQEDTDKLRLGGTTVPTVITACTNCGFIAQHALGALGMLEKEETKPKEPDGNK